MYVEGLVHITELGGEYFRFDDARQELRGERTGIRYQLGSRVQVQVSRVDLDGRRIDFRLVLPVGEPAAKLTRVKDDTDASADRASRPRSTRVAAPRRRDGDGVAAINANAGGKSRKALGKADGGGGKGKKSRR
jgi:ribonuclease R